MIRAITRSAYDMQKLRIEMGNRLCANFRAKLGLNDDADDAEAKGVLKELERRFRLITDGIVQITRRRKFKYDGVITSYAELSLISHYLALKIEEARTFRTLGIALEEVPIYTHFLADVKGCGPAMSGVIVSEIDITKARYASSIWKYAGLDVAKNGQGRSRKAEHLIDIEYESSSGEMKTRKGITFNPFLKTKLVGVLGSSFLRCASPYREFYDQYKHRIETDSAHAEKTKGHIHNMSIRYMIKMFLLDLYKEWRELEGLPVEPSYHDKKHGHIHTEASHA